MFERFAEGVIILSSAAIFAIQIFVNGGAKNKRALTHLINRVEALVMRINCNEGLSKNTWESRVELYKSAADEVNSNGFLQNSTQSLTGNTLQCFGNWFLLSHCCSHILNSQRFH